MDRWLRKQNITFGSWTKVWPERELGGSSPVHDSLRHSMIVCKSKKMKHPKINPGNTNLPGAGGGIGCGVGERNTYGLAGAVGAND